MTDVAAWIVSGLAGCLWLLLALSNGARAWDRFVRAEDDGVPFSPLVGGISGAIAVLVVPLGTLAARLPWVVIPLVLDFGSLPYLLWFSFGPAIEDRCVRRFAMKADVDARNRFGQTPLHCAALLNMADRCQELIDRGADLNARDRWGQTPLDKATMALSDEAGRVIAVAAGVAYRPLPRASA